MIYVYVLYVYGFCVRLIEHVGKSKVEKDKPRGNL